VNPYLHIGGNTPKAKWIVSDKYTSYSFVKTSKVDGGDDYDEGDKDGVLDGGVWVLKVGSKVRVRVLSEMQLKLFGDQRRVNFVSNGVWALKFPSEEAYRKFLSEFQDFLFENVETTVTTLFFFL
jgi:hypothetical protein